MKKIKAMLIVGCLIFTMIPALSLTACADLGYSVGGKVQDEEGNPIAGVKVRVTSNDDLLKIPLCGPTSTNEDGGYSCYIIVECVNNGERLLFTFSKEGYKTTKTTFVFYASEHNPDKPDNWKSVPTVTMEQTESISRDLPIMFDRFPLLNLLLQLLNRF